MKKQQNLAIFDLDNTLLAGDSDHAWGEFLIARDEVDIEQHRKQNDQFYNDYLSGSLDITAYLKFAMAFIAGKTPEALRSIHNEFVEQMIKPMLLPKACTLLEQHKSAGDFLLMITATNDFITKPISQLLGLDDILACTAEIVNGKYTGKHTGTPCFQAGKVERLSEWLKGKDYTLDTAYFYSDSHNDLPLLATVGKPIAVDPDEKLQRYAEQQQWPVISLR